MNCSYSLDSLGSLVTYISSSSAVIASGGAENSGVETRHQTTRVENAGMKLVQRGNFCYRTDV